MLSNSLNTYEYITEFTGTYKQCAGEPIAIREARCTAVMMRHWPCPMEPGDRLVGRMLTGELGLSPEPLYGRGFAFFYDANQLNAMLGSDEYDEEQKCVIREIRDFWEVEQSQRKLRDSYPEYMKYALPEDLYREYSGVAFPLYRIIGAYLDYHKLLRLGLGGLRAEAERRLARARASGGDVALFTGMRMALDTLSDLCLRYAASLREEFPAPPAQEDRAHRMLLAGALENIAEKPPATFLEAMQLSWLYSVVAIVLNYGRMDDYLGDFLARDLQNGTLTEQQALDYTVSLWRLIAAKRTVVHGRVIIGGRGRKNEASADRFALLAIEASRIVADIEPQLSLRFYNGQNPELMERALDCIGAGTTYPILYNDDVNIPAVMDAMEVPYEEAEDYMMLGCGEYELNYRSLGAPSGIINLLKTLEVTLFDGYDMLFKRDMGLKLGGLLACETFDELYAAYRKQFRYYTEIMAQHEQLAYEFMAKTAPLLYWTMLYEDCMERGRAILDGGIRYLGGTYETYGNTNTANSLFAVKKAVYEQKLISRETLLDALRADFEGYEDVHKVLLGIDKFGNDLKEVDAFASEFHDFICNTVRNQRERTDLHSYLVVVINNDTNTWLGRLTGASADGRRAREAMANGNNPMNGTDKNGITAMLNSLVKLNTHIHAGSVQNMKFSKELFNERRDILEGILKTYFENGGQQAMITVISREDLENAMRDPAQYSQLMVRVGGFSARFVTLAPAVQQEIASRTTY